MANTRDHEAERGEALSLRVDRFPVVRVVAWRIPPQWRLRRCAAPRGDGILCGLLVQDRHSICPHVGRRPRSQTQRLAALGFMVAGVCHEVSNPLAAVHSMLQILQSKRGVTPETLEKGLASISANVARVLAITRKLGDFSRVGTDSPAAVCVDAAMEEALALLRHSSHGADVHVTYRGAPDARVLARPATLQQVLFNIVQNAAQAMNGVVAIDEETRVGYPQI